MAKGMHQALKEMAQEIEHKLFEHAADASDLDDELKEAVVALDYAKSEIKAGNDNDAIDFIEQAKTIIEQARNRLYS
ncbi:hypothetical protein [Brevibacillus borstelensis]|uniref:hypothetical protein n=1 Tax=Brevibacillus borstelensis TaxID=45462 RepID=UPI00287F873F|nr:hypothetical protein [Brevibacillus borstelensis]WNF07234.1 hypothetical protein RFB14_07350 [Brevibacillus borstelensis]